MRAVFSLIVQEICSFPTIVAFGKWLALPESFRPSLGMERMARAETEGWPPALNSMSPLACTLTVPETCLLPIPITVGSGQWMPAQGLFRPWPEMEPLASVATAARPLAPNLIYWLAFLTESQATAKVTY